jgi:hypothetical protein
MSGNGDDVVEAERTRLDHLFHELREEGGDVALVQGEQHLFLAREVEVDRALGEPGGSGDLGHVRHPLGMLEQHLLGGIEDRLAADFLLLGADRAMLFQHA